MTGSLSAKLANAEAKLSEVQSKLDQLAELKAIEATLINQASKWTGRVAQLRKEIEDEAASPTFFHKFDEAKASGHATPSTTSESQEETSQDKAPQSEHRNKLRALNKKLQQIEKLKTKGEALDPEAAAKVASEPEVRQMVATLEKGNDSKKQKGEAKGNDEQRMKQEKHLPADLGEREKRLRALRKKLQDIENLKGREEELNAEANAKIDSEQLFLQEVAALEAGSTVFVFDEVAAHTAKKFEAEKHLKKLNKKLEQIQALKSKDAELDMEAFAKVESEHILKKEINRLQDQIGVMNKQERERVAQRLGWTEELATLKAEEKRSKKAQREAKMFAAGA